VEHRFTGPSFTIGIEEELMIVDTQTLELVNSIEGLLEALVELPTDGEVKPELMESVCEISTTPCLNTAEAGAQLRSLRGLVQRVAAERGLAIGAAGTKGPRRLNTSRVSALSDAQLLYGSGHDIEVSGRAPGFGALRGDVWRERGFGDFWGYALVAEGAAEAMVEVDLSPWDAAAPTVLVEEAGGRVSDLSGTRAVDSGTFLSSNGILHDLLLERLAGS